MRSLATFVGLACFYLQADEYKGVVRSAGLPIPGAAVTASRDTAQSTAFTDENGAFLFADLAPGVWTVEATMAGFEPARREVTLDGRAGTTELELKLKPPALRPAVSSASPAPANVARPRDQPAPASGVFQQLAVTQALDNEVQTALNVPFAEAITPGLAQNANESFLVNGSLSRGLEEVRREDPFSMNPEAFRERLDALRGMMGGAPVAGAGGTPGGGMSGPVGMPGPGATAGDGAMRGRPMAPLGGLPPGGGPRLRGGGGPGGRFAVRGPGARPDAPGNQRFRVFGNRTARARDAIRGGLFFTLRNSALDARPYSISGQTLRKPSYAQSRFGVTLGGTLNIPKLVRDDRTFYFVNYYGTRSRNPFDAISTMPSALERAGDFSQSAAPGAAVIADPLTRLPFPNNTIPESRISAAARGLLTLIPSPNLPGAVQNYQILTPAAANSDNLSLRLGRSAGRKDRLSGSYHLQQRGGENIQLYGFEDTSSGRGQNFDIAWTHTFRTGFFNNLRATFSRNRNDLLPFFAYGRDWSGELGIQGTSREPVNFGPPNMSFTNFGGLSDAAATFRRDQTAGVSESILLVRGRHNLSFGGDYRRSQNNGLSQQNARGAYSFSGVATSLYDESGFPAAGTGFDFADFLLGLPQSSTIRFGNADTYFRGALWSLFAQDDWRVRNTLSLNVGLRYDVVEPLREKYGRMANLDIAPGFTDVAVVTPGGTGPYTGVFPDGLVNPDRNNVAPRIGLAWRPTSQRQLQVRAGYGWYYNSSVTSQAATRLAQQPPFAQTGSLVTSPQRPLSIENAFALAPTGQVTNSYAVDRYYRTGYAQTWNFSVQQELPYSFVLELGYLGTKGTRLDMQRWPNRTAAGSQRSTGAGNATGFMYDSSEANSIFHAGQVRLMRRFRRGLSANALYTFGKSIDNASTIGGGGGVVAQNDRDLRAERGLSSFDRRHTLNLFYVFTTAAGRGGRGVASGFAGTLLKDWTLTGGVTVHSGSAFTAQMLGNRSDQGGAGTIGSGRADATGLPVRTGSGFFNRAAFAVPAAGQFGNAARNTIPGPAFFSMNMGLGRTVSLGERRSLDLRMEANNLFNSVNISRIGTTVNAVSYGLALDAAAMRSMTLSLRVRF
jgi:hypothetical protein